MPGINLKRLDALQKMAEAAFADDTEQSEAITKSFVGLRAAVEKGATVTMDDISDILGEVIVEKVGDSPSGGDDGGGQGDDGNPDDPLAPVFKGLFTDLGIFDTDGSIRKSLPSATAVQAAIQKAYEASLATLDGAIDAAVEATAAEFEKAGRRRPPFMRGDGDGDEDCEDMEKLLKGLGVPAAIVKKIGSLQGEVDVLKAKSELVRFEKMAEDIGEGAAFAPALMKMFQADEKTAEEVVKRLSAKTALLKQNQLWASEIGSGEGGNTGGTAESQLTAKANEAVEKGTADAKGRKMTFAKAFTEACSANPDLYRQYREEKTARR